LLLDKLSARLTNYDDQVTVRIISARPAPHHEPQQHEDSQCSGLAVFIVASLQERLEFRPHLDVVNGPFVRLGRRYHRERLAAVEHDQTVVGLLAVVLPEDGSAETKRSASLCFPDFATLHPGYGLQPWHG
jgi:hypothetical protein